MEEQAAELWRGLEGMVVMVTGASSGIGLEFCLDLAKAGCRVVAAACRVERLNSLCEKINKPTTENPSRRAVAVEFDVASDGKSIEEAVGRAWAAFGRIDALINNAGVRGTVQSCLKLSENEWNTTMRTNLTGTWLVSKYVGLRMRDAKIQGSILNISSVVSLNRGQVLGGTAYVASKGAVSYLTKVMALELGVYRIRVNSINSCIFKSEITEALLEKEWINKVTRKTVPLEQLGLVDPALTTLVRYLIHESSEYVTGNIYIIDAGATLQGIPICSSL